MKWKCVSTCIEWLYDSCGQEVDEKDLDEGLKSLWHLCPGCGNIRVKIDESK